MQTNEAKSLQMCFTNVGSHKNNPRRRKGSDKWNILWRQMEGWEAQEKMMSLLDRTNLFSHLNFLFNYGRVTVAVFQVKTKNWADTMSIEQTLKNTVNTMAESLLSTSFRLKRCFVNVWSVKTITIFHVFDVISKHR